MVLNFMSAIAVLWIIFVTHRKEHYGVMAKAIVEATAPLASVKEGGILSIHCKVSQKDQKQAMSISRRLVGEDTAEKLALNKQIVDPAVHRNYFLAYRKLKDGSDVYFLSITQATRSDEGQYLCALLEAGSWSVEQEDSVDISVKYFPTGPVCDPTGPQTVMEDSLMTLNCSSESGNPPVSIYWEQTGSTEEPLHAEVTNFDSNGVYTVATFEPKLSQHKDAMFVCKIKSKYFSTVEECHMGPLSIIPNPDKPTTTAVTPVHVTPPIYTVVNETIDDCHEVCAEMTAESVFRWTIATVISGLLALVFLVFGIILLIKYCFALDDHVPPQEEVHDMPDMPGNVQYRIDGNRLYMTLERPSTSQTEAVYQGGEVLERQYILAPPHTGEYDGSYIGTPSRSRGADLEPPSFRTPVRRDSYTKSHESPIKGAEADRQSVENTTLSEDIDPTHLSYQGTPIRNGGTSNISVHSTPTRMLMDQVLLEAQSEGFIVTPGRRESEGYISSTSRDSERLIYGTPSRGDYDTRQRSLTPTLPPRRYKTHYV